MSLLRYLICDFTTQIKVENYFCKHLNRQKERLPKNGVLNLRKNMSKNGQWTWLKKLSNKFEFSKAFKFETIDLSAANRWSLIYRLSVEITFEVTRTLSATR